MRVVHFVIAATLFMGLPATALAQTPTSTQTDPTDHWFASGYLGSNFGTGGTTAFQNVTNLNIDTGSKQSINYGGEIGYVFGGTIGAEFMANYSPNFELADTLLQRRPSVSSYMFNLLAVVPIHEGHLFRPFASGGIGSVRIHSTLFSVDPNSTNVNINSIATTTNDGSQFGWDLGGGLMAFNGPWGIRGDVRYYKATTNDTLTDINVGDIFLHRQLSGLSFWNANFGLAFRW